MAQSLDKAIRDAYAAFARGDVDGYLAACTEDFAFHVPGRGSLAGTYRGAEGQHKLAQRAMEASGGTFQEEVLDVLVSEQHAVVLARHRLSRGGQGREYHTAHVYRVRADKLAECWEQPRDQAQFDEAWGPAESKP